MTIQTWWMTDNHGEEYKMILTDDQFIYFLDRCLALIKQEVSEIIITYDNGGLLITSADEN